MLFYVPFLSHSSFVHNIYLDPLWQNVYNVKRWIVEQIKSKKKTPSAHTHTHWQIKGGGGMETVEIQNPKYNETQTLIITNETQF